MQQTGSPQAIRVFVVEDSAFMRRAIVDLLEQQDQITVVGTASNGEQAVAAIPTLQPDVVIMDIQMPVMNGLQATEALMKLPDPPAIIIFSGYTKDDADLVVECLQLGAFSCVNKPSGALSLNIAPIQKELVDQIRAASKAQKSALKRSYRRRTIVTEKTQRRTQRKNGTFPIVIIGASTGGPPVLREIFADLPQEFPAAIVVVQHMPPYFTKSLAKNLNECSPLVVREAKNNEILEPGVALVAPGDYHLELHGHKGTVMTTLTQAPPIHGLRPAIDITMLTAAALTQTPLIGLICTGMGADGAKGLLAMKKSGAVTLVQDPRTCVVDSMVQEAMKIGAATTTVRIERMADSLRALVM